MPNIGDLAKIKGAIRGKNPLQELEKRLEDVERELREGKIDPRRLDRQKLLNLLDDELNVTTQQVGAGAIVGSRIATSAVTGRPFGLQPAGYMDYSANYIIGAGVLNQVVFGDSTSAFRPDGDASMIDAPNNRFVIQRQGVHMIGGHVLAAGGTVVNGLQEHFIYVNGVEVARCDAYYVQQNLSLPINAVMFLFKGDIIQWKQSNLAAANITYFGGTPSYARWYCARIGGEGFNANN